MSDVVATVKRYILEQFLPGEDPAALTATTPLITGGVLDSLATPQLVSFLEKTYGFELAAHEIDVEQLDSLERIAELVNRKRPGPAS